MPIYDSVNGVARRVVKMYDEVNGVAREVTKSYDSVNGVARLCHSSGGTPESLSVEDSITNDNGNSELNETLTS